MEFISKYQAKTPDEHGFISYTDEENDTWRVLYQRQIKLVEERACEAYLKGLSLLALTDNKIPQIPEINARLKSLTGFEVSPVEALISARDFFDLLAARKFPVATFIRTKEELNYVTEPDVFHEIFGHCPMLTEPSFADFIQSYGQMVLTHPEEEWPLLQRLFWFTVEFGLIRTAKGTRIYGGGILSSIGETVYSLESDIPLRVEYVPLTVLRTPYRIDEMQPVYFVIESFNELYRSVRDSVKNSISKAKELGEFPPLFKVEKDNPCIHIFAC